MSAPLNIRMKVKKLLRLCNSPNPHEAARAEEEAGRLMRKYHLTRADFEDDVIDVIDEQRDPCRHRLAHAIGLSRRISTLVNKRGQIAYRGKSAPTHNAKSEYQRLVEYARQATEAGMAPHDPGFDVWRLCFWIGFVSAVTERLVDDEVRAWRPEKTEEEPVRAAGLEKKEEEQVVVGFEDEQIREEAAPAVKEFESHFDPRDAKAAVRALCERAVTEGKRHGRAVRLEAWNVKPTQKALEAAT